MAVETITLGTVKARASHILTGLAAYSTAFGTELTAAAQAALREFVLRARPMDFRGNKTISVVAGTSEYSLDDKFMEIIDPGVTFAAADFRTLFPLSEQEYAGWQCQRHTAQGEPTHYWIDRRHTDGAARIKLFPTPSANRTINYYCLLHPDTLLGASDGSSLDVKLAPEYHHLIPWGMVAQFPRYLATNPDLQFYWNKWEEGIKLARENSERIAGRVRQRTPYRMPRGFNAPYYPFSNNPSAPVTF